jgi:hypothetical protein
MTTIKDRLQANFRERHLFFLGVFLQDYGITHDEFIAKVKEVKNREDIN